MTGRKPRPTALKLLRMTTQKAKKLAARESSAPGPLEKPPDWLTATQKEDWQYAIENAPRDVLKKIDRGVLAVYIVAQDTHSKATIQLQTTQLLVKSPTQGIPIQNPYLPIINRQALLMIRAAAELGFTPCARARIDAGGPPREASCGDWDSIANA